MTRSRSKAIAHFKRTGLILPGAQGEVADWLANRRSNDEQLRRDESLGGKNK